MPGSSQPAAQLLQELVLVSFCAAVACAALWDMPASRADLAPSSPPLWVPCTACPGCSTVAVLGVDVSVPLSQCPDQCSKRGWVVMGAAQPRLAAFQRGVGSEHARAPAGPPSKGQLLSAEQASSTRDVTLRFTGRWLPHFAAPAAPALQHQPQLLPPPTPSQALHAVQRPAGNHTAALPVPPRLRGAPCCAVLCCAVLCCAAARPTAVGVSSRQGTAAYLTRLLASCTTCPPLPPCLLTPTATPAMPKQGSKCELHKPVCYNDCQGGCWPDGPTGSASPRRRCRGRCALPARQMELARRLPGLLDALPSSLARAAGVAL